MLTTGRLSHRTGVAAPRNMGGCQRAVSMRARAPTPFVPAAPAASRVEVRRPAPSARTRVAAAEPVAAGPATKEWVALIANAEFFFNDPQNESVAEQLRERVRYFGEQSRERDFYLVPDPVWLDAKFPQQAKQVKRPCVALVSTDVQWITFMKLRLDRVLKIELKGLSTEEVLQAGGKVPDFKPPENWTAPYPPYTPGWWNVFIPGQQ